MKKYIYLTLFILLVTLIVWGVGVSQNDQNASQANASQAQTNSLQNSIKSAHQDILWAANVQKHLKILKADLDGISNATNNSNYTALAVYAQQTVNDTQNAIQENDQYTVSSKLQDAQNEWRAALQDYNSASQFLLQGANEAKNGTGKIENLQKARTFSDSGTDHLKKALESSGIK